MGLLSKKNLKKALNATVEGATKIDKGIQRFNEIQDERRTKNIKRIKSKVELEKAQLQRAAIRKKKRATFDVGF